MNPVVGSNIFAITADDLLTYRVQDKLLDLYRVVLMHSERFGTTPSIQDVLYQEPNLIWHLKVMKDQHDIVILGPAILSSTPLPKAECNSIYKQYKSTCQDLFQPVPAASSRLEDFYLIDRLLRCRDLRIIHMLKCGSRNPGHLDAILEANRLLNYTLSKYR